MPSSLLSRCAVIGAVIALLVSLIISGTFARLGLFRLIARYVPRTIGLTPAFASEPWAFTHADVALLSLKGQHALITGANSGVGFETALALARRGAHVALACRNAHRCALAADEVRRVAAEGAMITTYDLDTSSLASVRNFAASFSGTQPSLDMLFLNAGFASAGTLADGTLPLSIDGIELVMATNHVGHSLLYTLLLSKLVASKIGRVVLTSSASSFDSYPYGVATDLKTLNNAGAGVFLPLMPYGQSKLAQILFAQEATEELRIANISNVYINSFHPGMVSTGIWGKNPLLTNVMKTVEWLEDNMMWECKDGALTMIYLGAAVEEIVTKDIRGQYFHPQAVKVTPPPHARDLILQKRFFQFTKELIAMEGA